MTTPELKKVVLWEYDAPILRDRLLNYSAGIWFWTMTPGDVAVIDDNGNTGYYTYKNAKLYNVKSLRVDDANYTQEFTYADMYAQNESFYYDTTTTYLYIHFDEFEPPLDKQIYVGVAVGYTLGVNDQYYFNDEYYENRIEKISSLNKSKDPLFFGLLKFQSGTVDAINQDGEFDDFKSRNLYAQETRLLVGDQGADYSTFNQYFSGNIGDNSSDWQTFNVKIEDVRKGLTVSVADNLLNQTTYPYLDDGNVDEPKPVAYGQIFGAPSINLNENESTSTFTFLICDTEFNDVDTLDAVYVEGVAKSPGGFSPSAGTFTLTNTDLGGDPSAEVTIDFTMDITNGVDIIKDLMLNYDDKNFTSTNWNVDEVNETELLARNTSLYIDDDKSLTKALESVAFDCDALFFAQDDGVYTIRIYDPDRVPVKQIYKDEWIGEPKTENTGSQFLTSAVIKYKHDIAADTYMTYENKDYKGPAFANYKRFDKSTFITGLTTEADAIDKSNTILEFSANIPDVITRSTVWGNSDLEIMDFIIASPNTRFDADEELGIYEVLGIVKNFETLEPKLTLRFIKSYTPPITTYFLIVDNLGNNIVTDSGNTIIGAG